MWRKLGTTDPGWSFSMASTTTTNGSLSNGPVTGPVGPTQQILMSDAAWFSWALLLSIALMLSTLLMLSSVDAEHFSDAEQCEHWCLMLHGAHIRYLWFQLIQPHRTHALLLMKYLRGVWWTLWFILFLAYLSQAGLLIGWRDIFNSLDHLFCVVCRWSIIAQNCPASFLYNNI